jgi:hypothetical protein
VALIDSHRIVDSVNRSGAGVELVRLRAFCSCGWCSPATYSELTHARAKRDHLCGLEEFGVRRDLIAGGLGAQDD